jgi:hypothetical protein
LTKGEKNIKHVPKKRMNEILDNFHLMNQSDSFHNDGRKIESGEMLKNANYDIINSNLKC